MATASTKAQSNDSWLDKSGKNGNAITFVDSGGSNKVAWQVDAGKSTANKNAMGQTYAQGTIHKGSHGTYAVYDGAQNYRGVITGDGKVYDGDGKDISATTLGASALAALKGSGATLDGSNYDDYKVAVEADRQAARESHKAGSTGVPVSRGSGGNVGKQRYSYETDLKPLLDQWREAAEQQAEHRIDNATKQGVTELERGLEDAQGQFRAQQSQIAADEAAAKDNAALYAELRGDRGGIGQAQYASVMNTAARNRQSVASAQTKLSTDVARQITDLRAQGEFQKADAVLTLAQDYLGQLVDLEQWAVEFGLDVDQFNESVRQWEAEFQQKLRAYDDSWQLQLTESESKVLSEAGEALLKAGILPGTAQLAAMGLTEAQAQAYLTAQQLSSGKGGSSGGKQTVGDWRQELYDAGKFSNTQAVEYLMQRYGLSRLDAQSWVYGEKEDASYADWASSQRAQNSGGKRSGSTKAQLK